MAQATVPLMVGVGCLGVGLGPFWLGITVSQITSLWGITSSTEGGQTSHSKKIQPGVGRRSDLEA